MSITMSVLIDEKLESILFLFSFFDGEGIRQEEQRESISYKSPGRKRSLLGLKLNALIVH